MESLPALDRADLLARRERFLVKGSWTKADVWQSRLGDGTPVVVKEFVEKLGPVRLWGWLQIAREARFLALLRDLPQVPRILGRTGRLGFAMELLDVRPLHLEQYNRGANAGFVADLREVLTAVHARGIVHLDLRGRENVALRNGSERIVVLDWAGAAAFREGSLARRWLFPALRAIDEAAFVKWKQMLAPELLDEADRALQQRFLRWRRLWPFNRKGVGWTPDGK